MASLTQTRDTADWLFPGGSTDRHLSHFLSNSVLEGHFFNLLRPDLTVDVSQHKHSNISLNLLSVNKDILTNQNIIKMSYRFFSLCNFSQLSTLQKLICFHKNEPIK